MDSLFIVVLIVCGFFFVFGTCFVMQYLVSFLVLQLSRRGRETLIVFLLSCGC